MSAVDLYVIEYLLHGKPRSFVIRTKNMNNAEAWQWASCDAGIAPIPRPGRGLSQAQAFLASPSRSMVAFSALKVRSA